MAERLNYAKAFPEGIHEVLNLEKTIRASGLESSLLGLVKTRASQMNGCAIASICTPRMRAPKEKPSTALCTFSMARDAFLYAARARSLAWTETLTNIQQGHASDEEYAAVRSQFDEAGLVRLTLAITQINTWNRIAIGFRAEPGIYQPTAHGKA